MLLCLQLCNQLLEKKNESHYSKVVLNKLNKKCRYIFIKMYEMNYIAEI